MVSLIEPTLLLDKEKCLANIRMIVNKARNSGVVLRPHFKTHQSHAVGRWFREMGVTKITVSSLRMAEYFAADGWNDITVAFPVNVHEHERINQLAEKIRLNLLVVDSDTVSWLARVIKFPVGVFIEIDNGYHRTGISPADFSTIDLILSGIRKHSIFQFAGFLGHAGHSYKANGDREKILSIHEESIRCVIPLKKKYRQDYPDMILSTGDTPTCSLADTFSGIDEIRPGNLVFYDMAQYKVGSCNLDQIAVAMACPVVATYPEREEVVIYGGAVHFSKDFSTLHDGSLFYGRVVKLTDSGWSADDTGMYIKSLSQEHGIIHAPATRSEKIKIGDFVGVLPIHSCLTADAMKHYITLQGEMITKM